MNIQLYVLFFCYSIYNVNVSSIIPIESEKRDS